MCTSISPAKLIGLCVLEVSLEELKPRFSLSLLEASSVFLGVEYEGNGMGLLIHT